MTRMLFGVERVGFTFPCGETMKMIMQLSCGHAVRVELSEADLDRIPIAYSCSACHGCNACRNIST